MASTSGVRRIWVVAIVVGIGALAALNWPRLFYAAAMLVAEKRPALLVDAKWNEPTSAHKFSARFHPGTSEGDLLTWLEANKFKVDRQAGRATRRIGGLPCNEEVEVKWRKGPGGALTDATALVREAGCL
jgi:hypothetical protein